jgi:hypothetical protein
MMRNKFLAEIGNLFGDFGCARAAVNTFERLNALSDASLARQACGLAWHLRTLSDPEWAGRTVRAAAPALRCHGFSP